jgi:hypothetical protein
MYDREGNPIGPTNITYVDGCRVGLPKWPGLVVQGKRVTEKQAAEILIRTSGLDFWSNDQELEAELRGIFGLASEMDMYEIEDKDDRLRAMRKHWDDVDALRERYGILSLKYLRNSQIVSTFIGGPHGWLNWSGDVFTNTYNIGKWPEVETVAEEWAAIAEAFPYLDLTCQLQSGETSEGGTVPVVEYVVKDGHVIVQPITASLAPTVSTLDQNVVGLVASLNGYGRYRECGISPEALKQKIIEVWGEIYRVDTDQ